MLDIPSGRGIAFDTNMLARPTQRRLMTLWCELAGSRTAVLPQVLLELTAKPTFQPPADATTRCWRRTPGEGFQALLTMALASAWPDDAARLTIGDAENVLGDLCARFEGATMPQTAARLPSRFAADRDLPSVLRDAGEIAARLSRFRPCAA